jgi:hypothetical protein
MAERSLPHFLRVVRALARVSSLAPAVVIPVFLAGCGGSEVEGLNGVLAVHPEDASASDGAVYDGMVTGVRVGDTGVVGCTTGCGIQAEDSGVYDGQILGVVPMPEGGGGIQVPPDGSVDGGPLNPPELPA